MSNSYVKDKLISHGTLIDRALNAYIDADGIPSLLKESMAYSLFAGGKRLRPSMAIESCLMFGGDFTKAIPIACALEMIHTYSLIHDDLPAMDDDDTRRGKPTNHKVYGEGHAILAGDGLLSYAMQILFAHASDNKYTPSLLEASLSVAKGAGVFGMVAGQSLDLKCEGEGDKSEFMLHAIHKGKTAAMLKASVVSGAYVANASKKDIEAMTKFGDHYGMLFQITDDILDASGDDETVGKTLGKDERDGKLTFVTHYKIDGARARAEQAAANAKAALVQYADKAKFFMELVDYTLLRKA